ncbi:UNVERIFIED_CONTAM: hypothetical protein HDU68_000837 [Siphonaria sp. JEL0065]|nr:hypothetical protein HDU68_000837 [Siphonaria sp. JEL0065]
MQFFSVLAIAGLATAAYIPPLMIHLKSDTAPTQQPEQSRIAVDRRAPVYRPPQLHLKQGVQLNSTTPSIHRRGLHLTDHGGPVLTNVQVHPIWYGNPNYQQNLLNFYNGVTQSAWMDSMFQYRVGRGSSNPAISFSASKSSLDDEKDIQPFLYNLVKTGQIKPNANTYYPIHFGAGIDISAGGIKSCQTFCAYHSGVDISALNVGVSTLYYGVMPDQGGNCARGCGSAPLLVNNLFSVSSHELGETVTDPMAQPGTNGVTGWNDDTQSPGENGDLCNAQQSKTVGIDGQTYVVQKLWSNCDNACVASSVCGGPKSSATTTTTKKASTATAAPTTSKFPISTTTTTIPSNGSSCYPAYSSTGIYASGSVCSSAGFNFVLNGSSWVKQAACNSSLPSKCYAPYNANTTYVRGSQVSYQGSDYVFDGTNWVNQGVCA